MLRCIAATTNNQRVRDVGVDNIDDIDDVDADDDIDGTAEI